MPFTRRPAVSADAIRLEQLTQEQLVIQGALAQTERIENVGHALLQAAASFCGQYVTARTGIKLANAYAFGPAYERAARSLGFTDTLVVVSLPAGSAAERAGVRKGDRLLGIEGKAVSRGRSALSSVNGDLATASGHEILLSLQGATTHPRDSTNHAVREAPAADEARHLTVEGDRACPFDLVVLPNDELNAAADGRNVFVNSGIIRFVQNDAELATVLAHEIAHNAMRHIQAKRQNASLGALFGAILDVAAATQGARTNGELTRRGTEAGGLAYSQDFELEADYVGLYILARAGFDERQAPRFWRRMAQENPLSITYASTHPTTAERFVRLQAAVREIGEKLARGEVPEPERPDRAVPGQTLASAVTSAGNRPSGPSAGLTGPASPAASSGGSTAREARAVPRTATTPKNQIPGDPAAEIFYWVYGPPIPVNGLSLAQVRLKAHQAYFDGMEFRVVGWWDRARDKFFEATQLDGGEPVYHAALGALLLKQGLLVEAEGVLSAAALLQPMSEEYRRLLADVKIRRLQNESLRRKP